MNGKLRKLAYAIWTVVCFSFLWGQNVLVANAETMTYGDWTYEEVDGKIQITGYTGTETIVEVPAVIDGREVYSLFYTFEDNTTITQVILPKTVRTLYERTFGDCINLTTINLDNVTSIKGAAFLGVQSFQQ